MQDYTAHILRGVSGDFKSYQKQTHSGPETVDFATGEIRIDIPSWIREVLAIGTQSAPLGYCDIQGLLSLRTSYVQFLRKQGYELDEQHILITAGAKEALWLVLLSRIASGAKLLLPKTCWPPYRMWCQAFQALPAFYDPQDEQCAESLIAKLEEHRPSVLLLNFPHNPTGAEITQKKLQLVLDAAKALKVTIISDEVYRSFARHGDTGSVLTSICAGDTEAIAIDSASKMLGLAGLRIGFLVAHPSVIKQLCAVRSSIASCVSSLAQSALIALFQDQRFEQWTHTIVQQSSACLMQAEQILDEEGYEVKSKGAIYLWVKQKESPYPLLNDQIVLHDQIIQGVSGQTFGLPGYIRLCPVRSDATLLACFASRAHA